MKEKIEELIKEVGINEVEQVINQLKSKVNIKENLKQGFIELLTDCTISFTNDDIDYNKNGDWIFFYRKTENIFGIKFKIWTKFESKYNLNYQQLKDLLGGIVEEVLNYKGVTVTRNY